MCANECSTPTRSRSFFLPAEVRCRSLSSSSSRSSGCTLTLLPLLVLFVQRSRKGHAWHVFFGKRTTPPASNGIQTPAGQRIRDLSQSNANSVLGKRPPLVTRQALQYTSSSGGRSLTSSLLR